VAELDVKLEQVPSLYHTIIYSKKHEKTVAYAHGFCLLK